MSTTIDFAQVRARKEQEDAEYFARLDLTSEMLLILTRAVAEMREAGADSRRISCLLRHAADELGAPDNSPPGA